MTKLTKKNKSVVKIDRRTIRKPLKLDPDKVMELRQQGLGLTDIAKHQGVNTSTVWRFLDKHNPENKMLQEYMDHKADIRAMTQAKGIKVINMVLDTHTPETIIAMTDPAKNGLLMAANAVVGTRHQEEQLDRNKPTSIVDDMSSMIDRIEQRYAKAIDVTPIPDKTNNNQ